MRTFWLTVVWIICGTWGAYPLDWPQWRGPEHNGISRETIPGILSEELPVLWTAQVGTGFSTVSVQGEKVLTMGNRADQDTVWCLEAGTGKVVWSFSYPCPLDPRYYEGGPSATPAIHQGSVFTLSKKGHAFRLDLKTGKVIWRRDLVEEEGFELPEWSFASSPFIEGDRVLLNVGRQGLALSMNTGETLWAASKETAGYATVVPFDRQGQQATHLLLSAKSLLGFNARSGRTWWEFPWKTGRDVNAADPLVRGNQILMSSAAGTALLEVIPGQELPRELWRQRDMKWYFNSGVLIGNHVYSLHGTTHRPTELMCTDFRTGASVWAEPGFGSGGLMAAGNTVILFDEGVLTLFEATPERYRPIHRQKVMNGKCWTMPVLANGRIHCRNAEGTLACLRVP